jgi:hypothetical protein
MHLASKSGRRLARLIPDITADMTARCQTRKSVKPLLKNRMLRVRFGNFPVLTTRYTYNKVGRIFSVGLK